MTNPNDFFVNPAAWHKPAGEDEVLYNCPKCGRPKYYVNFSKQMSHCFRCKYSKRIPRMLKHLARAFKREPQVKDPEIKLPKNSECFSNETAKFLYGRKMSLARAYDNGWRTGAEGQFQGRLIIPITENGKIYSFVARAVSNEKPKELSAPNRSHYFYGYDGLMGQRAPIVLVEGIFDAEALSRCGYHALAIMGSFISDIQVGKLVALKPLSVTVMMDGDEAGWSATIKIRNKLLKRMDPFKVRIAVVPPGKDPDELSHDELDKIMKEAN